MQIFKGKKILLAAPTNFSINKMIAEELRAVGFEVFNVVAPPFSYKSVWQRIHNLGRKVFFNDYENKRKLRLEAITSYYENCMEQEGDFDFALFIRPDIFPIFFIESIQKSGTPLIGYQWDGMNRYPDVVNFVKYFDRFFVFDPADVTPSQLPLTNFCADSMSSKGDKAVTNERRVFFISSFDEFRFGQALRLKALLQNCSYDCHFIFSTGNDEQAIKTVAKAGFYSIRNEMSISNVLELVKESQVLIDIVISDHQGLSFRIFEALMYSKKLITTNAEVAKYDFYHPDNIFIFDGKNDNNLSAFLETPMVVIPHNIVSKYTFENWIKYVLDYGEYQPITLPSI